jgi:hypothetical protein
LTEKAKQTCPTKNKKFLQLIAPQLSGVRKTALRPATGIRVNLGVI